MRPTVVRIRRQGGQVVSQEDQSFKINYMGCFIQEVSVSSLGEGSISTTDLVKT